ncbi:MAG TPA: hypothetical protein VIT21_06490 [Chthoniobacterales bacterium]
MAEKNETMGNRSANRLHLAAMEEMEVRRLMTNDHARGVAAEVLGYAVVLPV